MTTHIAAEGERLDTIVYEYYGTLDVFEDVLSANPRLDVVLKDGDIVYLPIFLKLPTQEPELW